MPKEIWNEGRVVGLSAYEIYIKEFLETNPGEQPASEREWLASSLALGTSMLVKVPVDSSSPRTDYYISIDFPNTSHLCAANAIVGSFFHGDAVADAAGWATCIKDYGELISNTSSSNPTGTTSNSIPHASSLAWSSDANAELQNYLKIIDGIIVQPGTWSATGLQVPQKDLAPNMGATPQLRLHISDSIDHAFWLLLTGFSIRTVVVGESGVDGSVNTDTPEDGDFLGPMCFPWANKIVFSVPPAAIRSILGSEYNRTVEATGGEYSPITDTVNDGPIIDLKNISALGTYYSNGEIPTTFYPGSAFSYTVNSIANRGDAAAVLMVTPRYMAGSPGLYASRVTSAGNNLLIPIDNHAPGALKLLDLSSDHTTMASLYALRESFRAPNVKTFTYSMLGDALNIEQQPAYYELVPPVPGDPNDPDDSGTPAYFRPIASTYINESAISGFGSGAKKYTTSIRTGSQQAEVLSLLRYDSQNGYVALPTIGNGAIFDLETHNSGDLNWDMLLGALGNNTSLNILGPRLKELRSAIASLTPGTQYAVVSRSGRVSVEPVATLPNFFFTTLVCDVQNATTDVYSSLRIDLFGFSNPDATSTNVVSSFGTLTVVETNPEYDSGTNNWFQSFRVNSSYQAAFDTLVANLNPAHPTQPGNVVKIVCMPAPGYRATANDINNGAPISNTPNIYIGYINITNGTTAQGQKYDGILYVRNASSTSKASSTGLLCSLTTLNMTMRPSCKRTDGPSWS